ncbi:MAG: DUF432 domain-containing protein, partial [Methanocorpusculum sp.]|nr:DUF432 domain-containing protein [Methanocorpusculum sp.]
WTYESNISAKDSHVVICPVEPLNLPDSVTDFLEIDFSEIKIQPESKCVVFLTFPLEIGIFVETEDHSTDILDVVSFVYPKYSLYGQASRGVITRWHKSEVYYNLPAVKNYEYGVMRLEIENKSTEWVEIGKTIIYMKGLTLYYDGVCVCASASMTVTSENTASVTGVDTALNCDMLPCLSTFTARKVYDFYNINEMLTDTTFIMDMGLL